jgi:predicted ATP-dependent protease
VIAPLPAGCLHRACDLQQFEFDSTADIPPLSDSIGQERGRKALEFGLGIRRQGFNLYVMGSPGLGRRTLVRDTLHRLSPGSAIPADWCYIANFEQPNNPLALSLPAGSARQLRREMLQLIDDLLGAIPAAFQGDDYRHRASEIESELERHSHPMPDRQIQMRRRLHALERETAGPLVSRCISELETHYQGMDSVITHLGRVKQDIVDNLAQFRGAAEGVSAQDPDFSRYQVNILVDNAGSVAAPIVFEDHPSYQNLLGQIAGTGTRSTDLTGIAAGALQRANGGYLVLDADELLDSPLAWTALKRALRAREARIEPSPQQLGLLSTTALKPQPIPLDLKVVLIGSRLLFYKLKELDADFSTLFKVVADFAEELPREAGNEWLYVRLIATLQQREGLRKISREGVAGIIEHSARLAWSSEKLSLNLGSLVELLQEADHWAAQAQSTLIDRRQVQQAIEAQAERTGQLQDQLREQVLKDVIKIDTQGIQLAQVNGLTLVESSDDLSFGTPVRISATARLGGGELVDIERESEQGGPLHTKGVMILAAYLGERYAKHQPLSVSASLVFEQSYGPVEGDSASAAELCALLSSLGDIPLRQSLAITGSINQHGQLQAIGGVCQKIEGFFDLCKARGLSGDQGVIIPESNVSDLMLRRDLVQAVEDERFNVYAVGHVEQAMELLSGLPAGVADIDGIYPQGSVNYQVQLRLTEWLTLRQHYAGQGRTDN